MLNKEHISIGGVLLCTSNFLFNSIFASDTLSKSHSIAKKQEQGKSGNELEQFSQKASEKRKEWMNEGQMREVYQAFPLLGFELALQAPQLTAGIFENSQSFNPGSGNCLQMKKTTFKNVTHILKLKSKMGGFSGDSLKCANAESLAGEKIRQAFCEEILQLVKENPNMGFDKILNSLAYLKYLVAPVDCKNFIANQEVPNATSVYKITEDISSQQKSSPCPSPKSIELSSPFPIPDFKFLDETSKTPKELFPDMNFMKNENRIEMAQNIINIVRFLHKYNISHNDLQGHNFLIADNNYAEVYIIDFDQATFNSDSEKRNLGGFLIEYLFFTRKCMDDTNLGNINNEIPKEIQKYTAEELKKIETMLKESAEMSKSIIVHNAERSQDESERPESQE